MNILIRRTTAADVERCVVPGCTGIFAMSNVHKPAAECPMNPYSSPTGCDQPDIHHEFWADDGDGIAARGGTVTVDEIDERTWGWIVWREHPGGYDIPPESYEAKEGSADTREAAMAAAIEADDELIREDREADEAEAKWLADMEATAAAEHQLEVDEQNEAIEYEVAGD